MSLYNIDDKTGIDEYGMDHSNFSLHDEIAYNMQRAREKEQQQCLMQNKSELISHRTSNKSFAPNNTNSINTIINGYNNIKNNYLGTRNYQNRYRKGCSPSNVLYNTISNYQISPNPKMVNTGYKFIDIPANYVVSKIPVVGSFISGEKIGDGVANVYNAFNEADCIK